MAINKDIVEKIRKLFALSADNANENEANAALDMAHALMRKHGIESVDIEDNSVELDIVNWTTEELSQIDTFSRVLSQAVAKLFNCEQWVHRSGKHHKYRVKVCYVGDSTDVELCKEIWPYLVKTAKRLATNFAGKGWSPKHRSFSEAFALRVYSRADEISKVQAPTSGKPVSDDEKYALVVVKKEEAIQQWFDRMGIKLKFVTRTMRGEHNGDAIRAGNAAGDQINLNFRRQIGANVPQHLLH